MSLDQLLELISRNISGESAKRHVERLAVFDRTQASSGYDAALEVVREALAHGGLETKLHEYPADGRTKIHDWILPMAWELEDGELTQLTPEPACLGRADETRSLVCTRSPAGVFEGPLVHVGSGVRSSDYEGLDVHDCFVLASGSAMQVVRQAGPRGAVGVVLYPDAERALASPHLRVDHRLRPTPSELASLIPAFSVSKWCADQLLASLETDTVRLRGSVASRFTTNRLKVLETSIPGTDEGLEEMLLVAHLCHPRPSANDNASGSGLLVELAIQLASLAQEVAPRNTIRFLWVPEFSGSIAWSVDHPEELGRTLGVVNLDMVGESPESIGEPLRIYRAPNSIPTFLNACIEPIMRKIAQRSRDLSPLMVKGSSHRSTVLPQGSTRPLHWVFDLPASGSDHLAFMAAPYRIPAFMIAHEDPFWHTSMDTVDRVDPARLGHVGILAAVLALLPTIVREEPELVVRWTMQYAVREVASADEVVASGGETLGRTVYQTALSVAMQRLDHLRAFLNRQSVTPQINWEASSDVLRSYHDVLLESVAHSAAGPNSQAKPRRLIDGPLSSFFMEGLSEDDVEFLEERISADGRPMTEFLLQLCDDHHSLREIAALLSLDTGRVTSEDDVLRALRLLSVAGYVDLGF
jgi:hypothetical protein